MAAAVVDVEHVPRGGDCRIVGRGLLAVLVIGYSSSSSLLLLSGERCWSVTGLKGCEGWDVVARGAKKSHGDENKNNNETQGVKTKKSHNNNNEASNIKGAIEELGRNVYCYGRRHQAEFLMKTTEAIGDYVGQEYSKDMRNLVIDRMELSLEIPPEPTGKANEYKIEKYKEDVK